MDESTPSAGEGHAKARRTTDDKFHERLAASLQRYRRILDRLAHQDR